VPAPEAPHQHRALHQIVGDERGVDPLDAEAERIQRHGRAEPHHHHAGQHDEEREARIARAAQRAAERELDRHQRLHRAEQPDEHHREPHHLGIVDQQLGDRPGEHDDGRAEHHHHADRQPHRAPAAALGADGIVRAEVLPDQRRGGDREAEADQEREGQDLHADLVGRVRGVAVERHDPDEGGEAELERRLLEAGGRADAQQAPHPHGVEVAAARARPDQQAAAQPERDRREPADRERHVARDGGALHAERRHAERAVHERVEGGDVHAHGERAEPERRQRVARRPQRRADHEAGGEKGRGEADPADEGGGERVRAGIEPEDARERVREEHRGHGEQHGQRQREPERGARDALRLAPLARAPRARHERGGAGGHRHQHHLLEEEDAVADAGGGDRVRAEPAPHDAHADEPHGRLQQVGEDRRPGELPDPPRGAGANPAWPGLAQLS
jgi:hypothetical protein